MWDTKALFGLNIWPSLLERLTWNYWLRWWSYAALAVRKYCTRTSVHGWAPLSSQSSSITFDTTPREILSSTCNFNEIKKRKSQTKKCAGVWSQGLRDRWKQNSSRKCFWRTRQSSGPLWSGSGTHSLITYRVSSSLNYWATGVSWSRTQTFLNGLIKTKMASCPTWTWGCRLAKRFCHRKLSFSGRRSERQKAISASMKTAGNQRQRNTAPCTKKWSSTA